MKTVLAAALLAITGTGWVFGAPLESSSGGGSDVVWKTLTLTFTVTVSRSRLAPPTSPPAGKPPSPSPPPSPPAILPSPPHVPTPLTPPTPTPPSPAPTLPASRPQPPPTPKLQPRPQSKFNLKSPTLQTKVPTNPTDWLKAEVLPPGGGKKSPGIVITPYNDDGSCKTYDQVKTGLEKVKEFSTIRSYGTECEQVQKYFKAIKELRLDMRVMVGVKGGDSGAELKVLWGAIGDDWALVDTVAVGNEVINSIPEGEKAKRTAKTAHLVDYVAKVKSKLAESRHPEIPVVIVDTWVVIPGYIDICKHSDYLAVNAHPWFNPNQTAKDSGKFLKETVAAVLRAEVVAKGCSKPIRICEIGWPHAAGPGATITDSRKATPGAQEDALKSIHEALGGNRNTIYLTAFDEMWKAKQEAVDPLRAEKFWGVLKFAILKKN